MTIKHGRNGKKFLRAQQGPQFDWAAGTGASAGFRPEEGVRFSQTKLPTKPGLKLSRAGAQPTRGANTMMRQQPMAQAPAQQAEGGGQWGGVVLGGKPAASTPSTDKMTRRTKKRRARSRKKR